MSAATSKISSAIHIAKTPRALQSLLLFSSEIIYIVTGFVASLFLTRILGPELYGKYSYTIGLIVFIGIFFEFGLHSTAARVLAVTESQEKKQGFLRMFSLLTLALGVLLSLTVWILTVAHLGVKAEYSASVLLVAPLSFIVPFIFFLENASQGTNQIAALSVYKCLFNSSLLACLFVLSVVGKLTLSNSLLSYFFSLILSIFITVAIMGTFSRKRIPNWDNDLWGEIKSENKRYGLQIYVGRVATVATSSIDKLLIAGFVDAKAVGFYTLAYALAQPLSLLSRSVAFSKFRDFSTEDRINPKLLRLNAIWLIFAAVAFIAGGSILIVPVFSSSFEPVKQLLPILVVGMVFQGLYEPYNKFLSAHGAGRELKRISFISTGVNVAAQVIGTALFGVVGTAAGLAIAIAATYILYLIEYKKNYGKLAVCVE